MTNEQATVLMIQGAISELSPEKQKAVKVVLATFEELAKLHGEDCFTLALALVGAKLSAAA